MPRLVVSPVGLIALNRLAVAPASENGKTSCGTVNPILWLYSKVLHCGDVAGPFQLMPNAIQAYRKK